MNKYYQSNMFKGLLTILIILQPLLELDYLAYDFLDSYGLPRMVTILRFVVFPLMIMYGFYLYDQNKKRTLCLSGGYIALLVLYFICHVSYASSIIEIMYLPENFQFSMMKEAVYMMTLMMPFYLIYLFYQADLDDTYLKTCFVGTSLIISLPIVIGNLCVYSFSTYIGYTQASIFSWFTDGYQLYIPRMLAGKFFFDEGNTIGIILFMILPIIYHLYFKETDSRIKKGLMGVIFIQSMAMLILSTRVAVYGTILCAGVVIFIMTFCKFVMKNEIFKLNALIFPLVMMLLCGAILPYTPMIQNQLLDATNDSAVKNDDYLLESGKKEILALLETTTDKQHPVLIKAFEKYGIEDNLMSAVPIYYFMEWYPYTHDAYFWTDLLFNVPFYERVNGRQVQQLFNDYKEIEIKDTLANQLLGSGYSTFMNGSFLLEKDFDQQLYSFGIIGFVLMVAPWLVLVAFGALYVLIHFKEMLRSDILVYACALIFALGGAYTSGHTLDQFITTTLMALIAASLLRKIDV